MTEPAIVEWFGFTEKAIAALLASGTAARIGWVAFKKVRRFVGKVEAMFTVSQELLPNHGTSLRDSVDRIERLVTLNEQRHRAIMHADGESAWEAGPDGGFVWGSKSFLSLAGRTTEELSGNGFANCIVPEEREFVWGEWQAAIREARDLDIRFRMSTHPRGTTCVHTRAFALKDVYGKVLGYFATTRAVCDEPDEDCPAGECQFGQKKRRA